MSRLRHAWLVLTGKAFVVELPSYDKDWELEWTTDDSEWLQRISLHTSGFKLFRFLQQELANVAIWAVNAKDSVRSCGYAAGATYIIKVIESLFPAPEDKPAQLSAEEQAQLEIEKALSE